MATTKITVKSNGSLKVEGDFEIVDANGNVYGLEGREIISLCRCGHSKNMPFAMELIKRIFYTKLLHLIYHPRKLFNCKCSMQF